MQEMEPFERTRSWGLLAWLAALLIGSVGVGVCLAFGFTWWPILLLAVPLVGIALTLTFRSIRDQRGGHIPDDDDGAA